VIAEVWSHRDLVVSLVRRQYQLRYRQSFAGFTWAIIPPLATLAVAVLVFHRVAGVKAGGAPYPIFVLSGVAPWAFFASSLTFGIPSVAGALPMVSRFPFPRAALPLSMVGLSLLDLGVSMGLFVGFAYVMGDGLSPTAAWVPLLVLVEIVLAVGIVMLGSAMHVFARDLRLAVPLGVQLWLFVTPVMYPLSAVPEDLRTLYLANPLTGLIENFHRVLAFDQSMDVQLLIPSIISAIVMLSIGWWYFGAVERRFADVI
jgi:lipopolysaccharide transport system permease protein